MSIIVTVQPEFVEARRLLGSEYDKIKQKLSRLGTFCKLKLFFLPTPILLYCQQNVLPKQVSAPPPPVSVMRFTPYYV